jgi:hypothetical protein
MYSGMQVNDATNEDINISAFQIEMKDIALILLVREHTVKPDKRQTLAIDCPTVEQRLFTFA